MVAKVIAQLYVQISHKMARSVFPQGQGHIDEVRSNLKEKTMDSFLIPCELFISYVT